MSAAAWTTAAAPVLVNYLGGDLVASLNQSVPFATADFVDVNRFLGQIEAVSAGTSAAYNGEALTSFWAINPRSLDAYFSPTSATIRGFFGAPGLPERIFCGEHTELMRSA